MIPIKEPELKIPSHDDESIIQTLKSSSYAVIYLLKVILRTMIVL
jgi:hypothetical protein